MKMPLNSLPFFSTCSLCHFIAILTKFLLFLRGVVRRGKICPHSHNQQCDKKGYWRFFPKNHQRKGCCHERRQCVIGAGFGCPQIPLGIDIKENTQAIGNKSQQQGTHPIHQWQCAFPKAKCQHQRPQTLAKDFYEYILQRVFMWNHTGTVFFQPTEHASQKY